MEKYIELLKTLISTPSLSREEENAAGIIRNFLASEEIPFTTKFNNTWAFNKYYETRGALFERPFKRKLIDNEDYLKQVIL